MEKILDKIKTKKNSKKIDETKSNKDKIKKFTSGEVIFLIIATCLISLLFGYMLNNKTNSKDEDKTLDEFISTYNDLLKNYYEDIDKKELLSGAVNGMLSTLDQYSTLIDTETNENFYLTLEGSYNGVGIEISNDDNNNIVIIGVLSNSPAERAGLKAGDVVKKIDDLDLTNTEFSTLSNYIRKSTDQNNYKIIIEKDGKTELHELSKEIVTIKSVDYKIIEKDNHKIGYIYISIFSNTTALQFKNALDDLINQKVDSFIFDVRENTGGHLTTVVSMLSQLLSKEHIIYQVEKNNAINKFYSVGTKDFEYPIVIIQNSGSASAAELFAISLKENLNITVIGENSYGKGTIQELNYLSNGDSYKYTTKKWLSPKGNWINKVGVEPDIKVELDEEYANNPSDETDDQLQTAINELIK